MPPQRRRPTTPPTRRPKVAGLHRRTDEHGPEEADTPDAAAVDTAETPTVVAPAVSEPETEQEVEAEPESNGTATRRRAARRRHRLQDPEQIPEHEPEAAKVAEDDAADNSDDEVAEDTEQEAEEPAGRPKYFLPVALLVVALLIGGLGFWFMQRLSDARTGAGNDALSNVDATKDVVGAANTAVTAVLSYKFDDMAAASARAKGFLDGEAVGQYEKSMQALSGEITTQKLQVVVNPVSVGVVRLAGDDARVLVFADQIGVRGDKQPSGGPTQFAMDMHRANGKWKIVKLDFFEASQPGK